MELMLNELSIHGQFYDPATFRDAIRRIMTMRGIARRYGRDIYCHSITASMQVGPGAPMKQMIQLLPRDQKVAISIWLDKQGPFWNDAQQHNSDDLFGCNNKDVTGYSLAEAAYYNATGIDLRMVSVTPSSWSYTPIVVNWLRRDNTEVAVNLNNYWQTYTLESDLEQAESPVESWRHLEELCRQRFRRLTFTDDSFGPLRAAPFQKGAAYEIFRRMGVLDQFQQEADAPGDLSGEGRRLFNAHFMGVAAWFSDSTDEEKTDFRRRMTFRTPSGFLFCPWHGKVDYGYQYRFHFNWPVSPSEPLYVGYVGRKIALR